MKIKLDFQKWMTSLKDFPWLESLKFGSLLILLSILSMTILNLVEYFFGKETMLQYADFVATFGSGILVGMWISMLIDSYFFKKRLKSYNS